MISIQHSPLELAKVQFPYEEQALSPMGGQI